MNTNSPVIGFSLDFKVKVPWNTLWIMSLVAASPDKVNVL